MSASARVALALTIQSQEWESAVGAPGTLKKQLTAHLGGEQVGRLLIYREPDGIVDISGIGVKPSEQRRGIGSQLLDAAFVETCASHFTMSTGTTGDGTAMFARYGEGRRDGCRVVERPSHLVAPGWLEQDEAVD